MRSTLQSHAGARLHTSRIARLYNNTIDFYQKHSNNNIQNYIFVTPAHAKTLISGIRVRQPKIIPVTVVYN